MRQRAGRGASDIFPNPPEYHRGAEVTEKKKSAGGYGVAHTHTSKKTVIRSRAERGASDIFPTPPE